MRSQIVDDMFLLERGIGSAGVNQNEKLHAVVLNQKHVLYHQTNSFNTSQNTQNTSPTQKLFISAPA